MTDAEQLHRTICKVMCALSQASGVVHEAWYSSPAAYHALSWDYDHDHHPRCCDPDTHEP